MYEMTFSKRCLDVSGGKTSKDNDGYSQETQKVLDNLIDSFFGQLTLSGLHRPGNLKKL